MTGQPRLRLLGFAVIAGVLAFDQATKQYALEAFSPIEPIAVLPFLDLTLTWNRGVSFGLFGSGALPAVLFIGVALIISAFLLWQMLKAPAWVATLGYALIVGGAVGNVIDRAIYGAVIDFLLLHWRSWSWPVFNVADMSITFGVVLILIDSLWPGPPSTTQ